MEPPPPKKNEFHDRYIEQTLNSLFVYMHLSMDIILDDIAVDNIVSPRGMAHTLKLFSESYNDIS